MALDEQITQYTALDSWFKIPQGMRVAQAFVSELQGPANLLSGKILLQLGLCGDSPWLSMLRFRHKWIISPFEKPSTITASMLALPIERSSIDCIIAPMTLDLFNADKNPINEIDRVLKPMGYVVFLGINPVSFWGIAARWGNLRGVIQAKNTGGCSSLSLKKNMLARGYSQCLLNSFYYIPPVKNRRLIQHCEFFNEMGKMIWPFPAGFYCLILQKYQAADPSLMFNRYDDELLYVARN